MAVTVSEFQQQFPEFEEIAIGDRIAVNGVEFEIVDTESRSPAPGETVYYLSLHDGEQTEVLSWNPAHTVETLWLYDEGADQMSEGEEVESVEYSG